MAFLESSHVYSLTLGVLPEHAQHVMAIVPINRKHAWATTSKTVHRDTCFSCVQCNAAAWEYSNETMRHTDHQTQQLVWSMGKP